MWGYFAPIKETSSCVLVTQSCPTLCYSMNCSPPGSAVHGILQARILEWVPMPRGSSLENLELRSPALQADSLPSESPRKTMFTILDHQGSLLLKGAIWPEIINERLVVGTWDKVIHSVGLAKEMARSSSELGF